MTSSNPKYNPTRNAYRKAPHFKKQLKNAIIFYETAPMYSASSTKKANDGYLSDTTSFNKMTSAYKFKIPSSLQAIQLESIPHGHLLLETRADMDTFQDTRPCMDTLMETRSRMDTICLDTRGCMDTSKDTRGIAAMDFSLNKFLNIFSYLYFATIIKG